MKKVDICEEMGGWEKKRGKNKIKKRKENKGSYLGGSMGVGLGYRKKNHLFNNKI